MGALRTTTALARSCHPGPTVAVTVLTALLAVSAAKSASTVAVVTAAVGAGQLSIGWSNDLVDGARDRRTGRPGKPIAAGRVSESAVRRAIAAALVGCIVLSTLCGVASAAVHLLLGVAAGWAYNLGVKTTRWSFLPYAVAFGALPAVVTLAGAGSGLPPVWMVLTGVLLGVGAHLLNALPDLADDEATGVVGLPHRLGSQRVRWIAPLVLLGGSVVAVLGPAGPPGALGWTALGGCAGLASVTVLSRGRVPFAAAVGIAVVDVLTLVVGR